MDIDTARAALLATIPAGARDSAAAYLDETPYAEGEPVPAERGAEPAAEPLYLGFVDLEPGRNWGHACLYVHCGKRVRTDQARLPPQLAEGRRLTLVSAGANVPEWALFG
jgi:hypothetical protein